MNGQLTLALFPPRHPTWEDVQKGRARVVDRVEPCDKCADYYRAGRCTHTVDNYAYPRFRPGGMCVKHYLDWSTD